MRTRVGYAGGAKERPTYRSLGDHTESFQVDFDPTKVSYEELVRLFFESHDPTDRPWSTQYKAVLFVADDAQAKVAEASRRALATKVKGAIQTEIVKLTTFWPAEDTHQKYALRGDPGFYAEYHAIYPSETDLRESPAAARVNGYLGGNGTLKQLDAEIDSLGLSPSAAKRLRTIVRDHAGEGGSCPVR